jgi:hypothetical protein
MPNVIERTGSVRKWESMLGALSEGTPVAFQDILVFLAEWKAHGLAMSMDITSRHT